MQIRRSDDCGRNLTPKVNDADPGCFPRELTGTAVVVSRVYCQYHVTPTREYHKL